MKGLLRRGRWLVAACATLAVAHALAQSAAPNASGAGWRTAEARNAEALDSLSAEERAWIRANPVVRVVGLRDDPPLYAIPRAGDVDGLLGAVLDLAELRTGLRFEAQAEATLGAVQERLARRTADVALQVPPTDEMSHLVTFTRPVVRALTVAVMRRDAAELPAGGDFAGRSIAIEDAAPLRRFIALRYPFAQLKTWPSIAEALTAVSGGEADVYIGLMSRAAYQVERLRLSNLEVRDRLQMEPIGASLAVRSDRPELKSILDKVIAGISTDEELAMRRQWLPAPILLRERVGPVQLSEQERAWLAGSNGVVVAYDKAFAPLSFQDGSGAMSGLAAEYLRLMGTRLGLSVRTELAGTWNDVLAAAREGKVDVLVASARNELRRPYLTFIGPYVSAPTAIVVRDGQTHLGALSELTGRRLAILRGHFLVPTLGNVFPAIELLEFATQGLALQAVGSGKADAALGNLDVVVRLIQSEHAGRLVVANTLPGGDSELYFGVRADLPELGHILRKGLASITEAEHAQIRQKWLAVRIEQKIPWTTVLQFGVPLIALFVLAPLLYALRSRNRAMRRVAALSDLYAALSDAGEAIVRATDSTMLIREVCRIAVERGRLVCAWSGLVDPASGELREVAMFSRARADSEAGTVHPFSGHVPIDATADAVLGGERVVNNDLTKYPAPRAFLSHWLKLKYRAAAGFPFRVNGRVVGGVAVFADSVGYFDDERVGLIEKLATGISYALERQALEADRSHARDELELANRNLKLLSSRLIEAQESERRAIAQELHDELGQTLSAVKLTLHRLERAGEGAVIAAPLEDAIVTTDLAIQQVRAMLVALRPPQLDDLGLVPALRSMAERLARSAALELEFVADPTIARTDTLVETACYRIAQEAITNAVRHARASRLRISLRRSGDELELVVADNGVGFLVNQALAAARRGSIGIVGIRERAQLIGASIGIDSSPGIGTRVVVRFPIVAALGVEQGA